MCDEYARAIINFSRAISRVKWLNSEKTAISKTVSVLVLRVLISTPTPHRHHHHHPHKVRLG
jgi:hypothetical protein